MRIIAALLAITVLLASCDDNRIYEQNRDFDAQRWMITEQPVFEFAVTDSTAKYDLFCNIRNSVSYPYSRLFINYYLQDSSGTLLKKDLVEAFLFDHKTGKPQGESGVGDIYDQRIPILKDFGFPYNGKFLIRFEQNMRMDSLRGVLAVGLRVERRQRPAESGS